MCGASLAFLSVVHLGQKADVTREHLRSTLGPFSAQFHPVKESFAPLDTLRCCTTIGKSFVSAELHIAPRCTYFLRQQWTQHRINEIYTAALQRMIPSRKRFCMELCRSRITKITNLPSDIGNGNRLFDITFRYRCANDGIRPAQLLARRDETLHWMLPNFQGVAQGRGKLLILASSRRVRPCAALQKIPGNVVFSFRGIEFVRNIPMSRKHEKIYGVMKYDRKSI